MSCVLSSSFTCAFVSFKLSRQVLAILVLAGRCAGRSISTSRLTFSSFLFSFFRSLQSLTDVVKHREEDELAVPHQLESFRKGISRKTRPFPIGGIASTMSHLFFLLFTETREVGIGTKWSNVIRNGQRHSKVLTLRISDTDQGQKRPPSVEEHKSV